MVVDISERIRGRFPAPTEQLRCLSSPELETVLNEFDIPSLAISLRNPKGLIERM